MEKNDIVDQFALEYKELNDSAKEDFAHICSKFLNETFIVKSRKHDQYDFYFVQEYQTLFRSYFALTDYRLNFVQEHSFFYIETEENRSRVKLSKFETVLLLLLRLKHYENSKNAATEEDNSIRLDELIEKVSNTNIFHPEKKMTEYDLALKKLRRAKIIDFKGTKLDSATTLIICPTILVVLGQNNIDLITAELGAFSKERGKGKDENAD